MIRSQDPFEAMQPVDENEAIIIAPNEDRRLLSDS
jgi:hypothetical protein